MPIHCDAMHALYNGPAGDGDTPPTPSDPEFSDMPAPPSGMRALRFWLLAADSGVKLSYASISALVHTMQLVLGEGKISTAPPNTDINLAGCMCSTTLDETP